MSDDIKLSKASQGILDEVKKLPVLELADLVKAMEEDEEFKTEIKVMVDGFLGLI